MVFASFVEYLDPFLLKFPHLDISVDSQVRWPKCLYCNTISLHGIYFILERMPYRKNFIMHQMQIGTGVGLQFT